MAPPQFELPKRLRRECSKCGSVMKVAEKTPFSQYFYNYICKCGNKETASEREASELRKLGLEENKSQKSRIAERVLSFLPELFPKRLEV